MRFILVAFLFTICACTPPVVFDQPYPTGKENLRAIPTQFLGEYICESDSALVIVSEQNITIHRKNYFEVPLNTIEERENCTVTDNKMYVTGRQECIPLDMVNDSMVRGVFEEVDTMFILASGSIARMYKGHLMLNQEFKNGEWAVSTLSPQSGGDLIYKAITQKSNVKKIKAITPAKDITTKDDKKPRYTVKPTMKEFDELFNNNEVFLECEYLTKVNITKPFLN